MRIIDKYKDYYDYLMGVYGIDNNIVYDRRGSTKLSNIEIFSSEINWYDREHWDFARTRGSWKGNTYTTYYVLEVGNTHYCFKYQRTISEDRKEVLSLKTEVLSILKDITKLSDKPLALFSVYVPIGSKTPSVIYKKEPIENPILIGSCLTGIVSAHDMWEGIYNYISSTKEKDIKDSRTDIEKVESHGFDKKTSFRKM